MNAFTKKADCFLMASITSIAGSRKMVIAAFSLWRPMFRNFLIHGLALGKISFPSRSSKLNHASNTTASNQLMKLTAGSSAINF